MGPFLTVIQVIAALGLLNVWFVRLNKSTAYRGGGATNMHEEFAAYGLPAWMVTVVGALKVGVALSLIAGIWYHPIILPAALLLCGLMLGALAMHLKIHDPLRKCAPALGMLALAVTIVVGCLKR